REDHARTHFRTFIPLAIVEDVGSVVEDPTDTVAAEIAHNGTTLALGIGLDGSADRADAGAGLHLGNAAQEAFIGDLKQTLGRALELADGVHAAGVPVPAVHHIGDVNIDDVTFAQWLVVRDAVTDHMVDRGAGRFSVAAIVERSRQAAIVHTELKHKAVDLVCSDAGLDQVGQFI